MNPLPFESLEPHRFEDMVRLLVHALRDWQSIEATGRSGSDEGMDIRAFEKRRVVSDYDDEDTEESEYTVEGNLWVIQCKREKSLGPSDVKQIIQEGPFEGNAIYGYVLAAPVNFSKKSCDVFRSELRKKGVTEFALWGRGALEDMLLMPKNDHILFTFFGISLVAKRRSRSTEVRYRVNTKNKLYRIFGDEKGGRDFRQPVLLRDIDDTDYPWDEEIADFASRPRWEEFVAFGYHPEGLLVHMHEYYAYLDKENEAFDFTKDIDLIARMPQFQRKRDPKSEDLRDRVLNYWQRLPRKNQAILELDGLIAWEDILLIDDKGDKFYECPHLYVESKSQTNLVTWHLQEFLYNGERISLKDRFKRVDIIPHRLPEVQKPRVNEDKAIKLDDRTMELYVKHYHQINILFAMDGRYDSVKEGDVLPIANMPSNSNPVFLEITHIYMKTYKDLLSDPVDTHIDTKVEWQVGRPLSETDQIFVYECIPLSKWQVFDQNQQ